MSQPKQILILFLLAASLCVCMAARKPLITRINKGTASKALYTAPLRAGRRLVLDLSAPAVTSPCSGQTTTVTLSANTTNGANPLSPVSFAATAICASAPSGAAGIAGLVRSSASFPAQVASTQKVANSFALCLPSDGKIRYDGDGVGAAIFGGGPFFLAPPANREAITTLLYGPVPLRQPFAGNPGYFVRASNGIAIDGTRVAVSGALVVGLSTTIPYTQLRSDVYRPFISAFDRAMGQSAKVSAVSPFELCYDPSKIFQAIFGYVVPQVDVMLEGGTNFTVFGGNTLAEVKSGHLCFAFVQMKAGTGRMPAVVIGGFQMENMLVVLDNDKQQLSFSVYLPARGFTCGFNATRGSLVKKSTPFT